MTVSARIISILTALVLIVVLANGVAMAKAKTKTDKIVQGTVVTATDGDLIIRKGKADVTLMYDSASQKPATLAAGTAVRVHYRDEKSQRIVTLVEVTPGKTNAVPASGK